MSSAPPSPDAGKGRVALITGASAGIGAALARVFAAHGFGLVLTARREARLADLANELQDRFGVEARILPADLARPEACAGLLSVLARDGVIIDALVNNAGYGVSGHYQDTS